MHLLITGICGFAGCEIAKRWKELDPQISIVGIDNLSRRGSWRDLGSLQSLGVRVLYRDIRNACDVDLYEAIKTNLTWQIQLLKAV